MVNSKKNKTAFTLVELLVVISIIALLLAILMPTLQKARFQARKIVCGGNLRQISLAWFMYANTYSDKFPEAFAVDSSGRQYAPQLGNWTLLLENMWRLLSSGTYGVGQGGAAFYCPNWERIWKAKPKDSWDNLASSPSDSSLKYVQTSYCLYGYHQYSRLYGLIPTAIKTTDKNVSQKPLIFDNTDWYQKMGGFVYSNHFIGGHGKYKYRYTQYAAPDGGNAVMGDGSVIWRRFNDMRPVWKSTTSDGGGFQRFF